MSTRYSKDDSTDTHTHAHADAETDHPYPRKLPEGRAAITDGSGPKERLSVWFDADKAIFTDGSGSLVAEEVVMLEDAR